jgi:hypothetical protein
MLCHYSTEAFKNLSDGLVELGFTSVPLEHLSEDGFELFVKLDQLGPVVFAWRRDGF